MENSRSPFTPRAQGFPKWLAIHIHRNPSSPSFPSLPIKCARGMSPVFGTGPDQMHPWSVAQKSLSSYHLLRHCLFCSAKTKAGVSRRGNRWSGESFGAGFSSPCSACSGGLAVLAFKAGERRRSGQSPHGQAVPSALRLGGLTPLEGIPQARGGPLPVELVADGEALPGVRVGRARLLRRVAVGALYLGDRDVVGQGPVWVIALLRGERGAGSPAFGFIFLRVGAGVTQLCFSLRMAAGCVLHFASETSREGGSVSNCLGGIDAPGVNTVRNTCVFCCFHGHPKVGVIAPRRRKHKAMRLHDGGLF